MAHVWVHSRVAGLYTPAWRASTTETYFKSYDTAIAKRISDDVIILDMRNYSDTTRKHQYSVVEASSHLTQLRTYLGVDDSVESNIEYYLRDMEAQITTLSRARSDGGAYRAFNRSKQQIEMWCVYGGVKLPKELPLLEEQMDVVYKGFVQRRAKVDAMKEQKERERRNFVEAMRPRVERMRAELLPLWRQHKTQDLDDYFDHAEQTRAKYFGVSLKSGYYSYGFNSPNHYNHIRLSKDGKYLETDGHATVPLREACVLCDRLDKGKDVLGLKVGQYTILEKTEDYLRIGCHKFQWSELEHLRAICASASQRNAKGSKINERLLGNTLTYLDVFGASRAY